MKPERIGRIKFWPSIYSPRVAVDASFTSGPDDEGYQLVINLDTEDKEEAVKRGRKILEEWQSRVPAPAMKKGEEIVLGGPYSFILDHAEHNCQGTIGMWTYVGIILKDGLYYRRARLDQSLIWRALAKRGSADGPGPSLQPGGVSPMPDPKQATGQE